jgi:hypothetical protein
VNLFLKVNETTGEKGKKLSKKAVDRIKSF